MKSNIELLASQRLKEFDNKHKQTPIPIKKLGREEPITEIEFIEKNRYRVEKKLIEVSTYKNESNYKFLKIWKLYQPTEPSFNQYEYGKHGVTIPIKDAKKLIKELYNHFYPKKPTE